MNRWERIIIGIFSSLACAVSLLVLVWWISASLSIYHLLPISDQGIAIAALVGLGLGIFLDVLFLKTWIARFYSVDWRLAAPLYLFWVAIATAWFMGLPLGTLILGTAAGLYIGRRYRHAGTSAADFARQAGQASLLVALVTGMASLGIGLLALGETYVLAAIQRIVGTSAGAATLGVGVGIVLVLCLVLVALQYWCTRTAAKFAFQTWSS
jgi:hypothetical protein